MMMMPDGFGAYAAWSLILLVLDIWGALRVAKSSGLLAVGCFIFPPLYLFAMLRYWGDPDSDVRVATLLIAIAMGFSWYYATQSMASVVSEHAMLLSDEDIEAIRAENPQMAAQLEAAQAAHLAAMETQLDNEAFDEEFDSQSDQSIVNTQSNVANRNTNPTSEIAPPKFTRTSADKVAPQVVASQLMFQRGTVGFTKIGTRIHLPQHFRFISKNQARRMAIAHAIEFNEMSLGWLMHEKVDLANPHAWWVDVIWDDRGHIEYTSIDNRAATGDPLLVDPMRAPEAEAASDWAWSPEWNVDDRTLLWGTKVPANNTHIESINCYAAKLHRQGVLMFSAKGVNTQAAELCLRSVRLMASRTEFSDGFTHKQFVRRSDKSSGLNLKQFLYQFADSKPLPTTP